MYEQVRFEVRASAACDRVKASFEVRDMVLKLLPIMGLFYRPVGCGSLQDAAHL
jgi:hypothetical protein